MQDPVVIMNFTHIYEDETFYISEQKSSTSRSCEASFTPLSGPAPVSLAASSGPANVWAASGAPSDRPVSLAASSGLANARAASGAPFDRPMSLATSSGPATARAAGSGDSAPVRAASCASFIVSGSPACAQTISPRCMSATVARTPSSPFTPSILDFTTLSGTTGFCDDAAADEIRRRIADFPARGIHFLDNGNFHYLTRFWCEKISEDFALVVYDHHVDLRKPVFPGLMSCGSWIRDVLLRNSHCRAVLIIGPECAQADIIERELQSLADEDSFSDENMSETATERRKTADQATHASAAGQPFHASAAGQPPFASAVGQPSHVSVAGQPPLASAANHPPRVSAAARPFYVSAADYASHSWTFVRREADGQRPCASAPVRVCCFTEDDILDGRVARELPHLLDALHLPVYISIDKDVLSRKVLRTNWDQGIMTEAEFRHELDRFAMGPDIHILGVDICGEPAYNACRRLLDDTRDLRRSDGVNRRLLEHYLARVH